MIPVQDFKWEVVSVSRGSRMTTKAVLRFRKSGEICVLGPLRSKLKPCTRIDVLVDRAAKVIGIKINPEGTRRVGTTHEIAAHGLFKEIGLELRHSVDLDAQYGRGVDVWVPFPVNHPRSDGELPRGSDARTNGAVMRDKEAASR